MNSGKACQRLFLSEEEPYSSVTRSQDCWNRLHLFQKIQGWGPRGVGRVRSGYLFEAVWTMGKTLFDAKLDTEEAISVLQGSTPGSYSLPPAVDEQQRLRVQDLTKRSMGERARISTRSDKGIALWGGFRKQRKVLNRERN